jgi:actin-like ATPase involved in cell morphogenesis
LGIDKALEHIAQHFAETYNLRLSGDTYAADLLQRSEHEEYLKVRGRDIDTGIPQCVLVPSDEIRVAAQRFA